MEKLKMHSPDLTGQNMDRIAELFPMVVTETVDTEGTVSRAVDFDLLRQELSDHIVEGPQERYQLDWPGKRDALFTANAPIAKTLRPVRAESVDFDTTQNLFIEGDNLEALKLLQESYLGKVNLIYIDPPYNTGNDFVYNDDFAETTGDFLVRSNQIDEVGNRLVANTESNGRFHSDWLSMMYPRLKVARNLLADNGMVFVSIDDGESANLRLLMQEIFGADNLLAAISWEKRYTRSNNAKLFYSLKDTILVYRKSSALAQLREERSDENISTYTNPDDDARGPWTTSSYVNPATKAQRPNLVYPLTRPSNGELVEHPTHAWKYAKAEHQRHVTEGRLWWGSDGSAKFPRLKLYLEEMQTGVVPVDLWDYRSTGTTDEGGAEVRNLMQADVFDFPKPVALVRRILSLVALPIGSPDSIVMDFFAGSGTAAHAVLAKNAEDGGNRRFVMVQLPEVCSPITSAAQAGYSTIAEVSKERIRRAGKKILEGDVHENWNKDIGFRVLKIDVSNMTDVLRTPDRVQQSEIFEFTDSVKADRTGEDLLFQVLLDWGLELTMPIAVEQIAEQQVFVVEEDALVACFDEEVSAEVVRAIAGRKPLRAVFRDSGFATDADRINAEQIFAERSPATDVKTV